MLLFQAALIILYGTCAKYDDALSTTSTNFKTEAGFVAKYAMFQDTHIM